MLALQPSAMRRIAYAVAIAAASLMLVLIDVVAAEAQTRTLRLYHVHLKERTEIAYKRNGRFLPDGLRQANRALRDWREHSTTNMDPHLLDMLWEVQNRSGTRDYIHIIGGYRSPSTNRMLRSRSSGVADNSLHTQGKAIDFFIPDVPLSRVRAIALQLQAGGVGYYPRSGSPFVHIDTGNGRYWPRMNRNQLAQLFPNGNTIYLPADGRPLPGHDQAMAAFNQRRSSSSVQMASARSGGPTILSRLFGGADEAEDEAEAQSAPVPRPSAPARRAPEPAVQVAAAQPPRPTPPAQLPSGVPMPERNDFDTSARSSGASAPRPAAGIPQERQVAALDLARVPVPASAVRPTAAAAAVESSPEPASVEEALVAALDEPAPSAASAGQLAYVPTPSTRPPFEAVLNALPLPEAAPVVEAEPAIAVAALAEPVPAPRPVEAVADDATADEAPMLAQAQADLEDAVASRILASLEAPAPNPDPAAAEPAPASPASPGKGGRVLSDEGRARAAPHVVAVEEAIGRRIEVASLVTGLDQRASEQRPARSGNNMLVVDVPASMVAHGFAPTHEVSASDRFSGSAVNFLPVHRLD